MLHSGNVLDHTGAHDRVVLVHYGDLAARDGVCRLLEVEREAAVRELDRGANGGRAVAKLCVATGDRYVQTTADDNAMYRERLSGADDDRVGLAVRSEHVERSGGGYPEPASLAGGESPVAVVTAE